MNIKQALLHNTGWKVITMIFTFVNNIIIVRALGIDASAGFFYALAVFTLVSTVLRFGLENGIIYYTSKYPERTGPLAGLLTGITALQVIVSYFVLHYFVKKVAPYTLFWAVVFVTGNVLIYYVTAFYQVKRMYISINVASAVAAFLQSAVLLFFYCSNDNFLVQSGFAKNVSDSILVVLSAGLLLQLIWLCVYFYRNNRNDFAIMKPDRISVKKLFGYSAINFAATVIMFLVMRADFFFVEKYCSAGELGNYVQVAKIGQMALVFPGLLGGVIFPFSVNAEAAFTHKISFFCRMITAAFLLMFILFLVTGKFLFVWMLGADFSLMFKGLAGTFAGVYFLAMGLVLISYFEGKNKQLIVLLSGLATLLIIVAGDYLFVPRYGFMAAAINFSVANLIGFLILLIYFLRRSDIALRDIFIFKSSDIFIFNFWKSKG